MDQVYWDHSVPILTIQRWPYHCVSLCDRNLFEPTSHSGACGRDGSQIYLQHFSKLMLVLCLLSSFVLNFLEIFQIVQISHKIKFLFSHQAAPWSLKQFGNDCKTNSKQDRLVWNETNYRPSYRQYINFRWSEIPFLYFLGHFFHCSCFHWIVKGLKFFLQFHFIFYHCKCSKVV